MNPSSTACYTIDILTISELPTISTAMIVTVIFDQFFIFYSPF